MSKTKLAKILCRAKLDKWLRLEKRGQVTILSLHRISNEEDFFFEPIRPEAFENLVKYVLKHYEVVSFDQISIGEKPNKKPLLMLSFDDGYYDFYEYALPILVKYKLPSNHNVVVECADTNAVIWTQRLNHIFNHCRNNKIELSFCAHGLDYDLKSFKDDWYRFYIRIFQSLLKLGKTERLSILRAKEEQFSTAAVCRMMNWREIEECSRFGVEIGSHTFTHDSIPTIKEDKILAMEIADSKTEIEKRLLKPVRVIALPNGHGVQKVDDFVRRSGYQYLLYVNDGVNDLQKFTTADFVVLDRINLINESLPEMILRTELFQTKLKKYVRL